jgi:hypothetical protein
MKTNKELLELAAKAAGFAFAVYQEESERCFVYVKPNGDSRKPIFWNPLHDDGAALRLAVKLGIQIEFGDGVVWANAGACRVAPGSILYHGDPLTATRYAIVSAAALIGEKM